MGFLKRLFKPNVVRLERENYIDKVKVSKNKKDLLEEIYIVRLRF